MIARYPVRLVLIILLFAPVTPVDADIAVSANDNKVVLVNGRATVVQNPAPDTVTIIDLKASPPRVIAELEAPTSVVGPPLSVAITPDERLALVTRDGDDRISVLSIDGTTVEYTKRDMYAGLRPYGVDIASTGAVAAVANIGRGVGDHDTISLIDLRARPPRVVETVTVGQTPEGKFSPDGATLAVVIMNGSNKAPESPFFNDHGKLLLFRVSGTALAKVAEARIGHWSQGAAFSADGRLILVGNMVEKNLQVFEWAGGSLRDTGHRVPLGGGSAAVRTADR